MLSKRFTRILGGVLLGFGILLGFVINGVIVWGDLEASVFTDGVSGDSTIKNLNCPVLITPKEIGTVSLVVKNPADKMSERNLRAYISEGYATLIREIKTNIPIPPNGKQKVEWKIYPDDAAFRSVILFRVFIYPKYPFPSMSGNCGIVKIDLPWLGGNQILAIVSGLTITSLVLGGILFKIGEDTKNQRVNNSIIALVCILVVVGVLSYFGHWILGLLGLSVAFLLAGVIIFRR